MITSMSGAELRIDVGAIVKNWTSMKQLMEDRGVCAAVVKADSYGLGAEHIVSSLYKAGCRDFFVAYLSEGIDIRRHLGNDAHIFAIHGNFGGNEEEFEHYSIIPVLNNRKQILSWLAYTKKVSKPLPCALHFDTGMTRLGLSGEDRDALFTNDTELLKQLNVVLVMSHLSDGEDLGVKDGKSDCQLNLFKKIQTNICALLNYSPQFSLSASAGMLINDSYKFDITRPGACLYGFYPDDVFSDRIKLESVVSLHAAVLQIQRARKGQTVGYGSSYMFTKEGKVLTAALGYADGYFRCLSGKNYGWLNGYKLPVIGRVSMDLTTFDATTVPDEILDSSREIEIIGKNVTLNEIAKNASTIPYEIVTDLGKRYSRSYVNKLE